jgi:hypothetical protein
MEYLLDINNIDDNTFHNIKLHSPTPIQGGSYLAKMTLNDKPILFQMPKCSTKRGVASSGKRYYCDLLFTYDHTNVIDFVENIEMVARDKVFDKNELWFQDPPSLEDIEYNWNDSIKQTKQNFYLRTYVGNVKNVEKTVSVYNSNQEKINIDSILPSSNIITIVEITGLKFSSSSFHINYCLRQIMVLEEEKPIFNKCLINFSKKPPATPSPNNDESPTLTIQTTPTQDKDKDKDKDKDDLEKTDTTPTNVNISKSSDNQDIVKDECLNENPLTTTLSLTSLENERGEKACNDDKDLEILAPKPANFNDIVESHEQYPETDSDTETNQSPTNDLEETSNTELNLKQTSIVDETTTKSNNDDKDSHSHETKDVINNDDLEIREVDLQIPEEDEMFQLKKPDTVYLDMYRQALEKAKEAKIKAIQAYLELKNIKNKYMIQEVDEDDDNFSELNFEL